MTFWPCYLPHVTLVRYPTCRLACDMLHSASGFAATCEYWMLHLLVYLYQLFFSPRYICRVHYAWAGLHLRWISYFTRYTASHQASQPTSGLSVVMHTITQFVVSPPALGHLPYAVLHYRNSRHNFPFPGRQKLSSNITGEFLGIFNCS